MLSFINSLSIRARFIGALGLIFIVNLGIGIVSYLSSMDVNKTHALVDRISTHQDTLIDSFRNISHAHYDMVEYINTGSTDAKDLASDYMDKARSQLTKLLTETAGTKLHDGVKAFNKTFEAWVNTTVKAQIQFMSSPQLVEMAKLKEYSPENHTLIRNIDAGYDQALAQMQNIIKLETQGLNDTIAYINWLSMMNVLLSLLLTIIVAAYLTRRITNPLKSLINCANDLANNNWKIKIPHTENPDEIGNVARALKAFQDNGQKTTKLMEEQLKRSGDLEAYSQNLKQNISAFRKESTEVSSALEEATQQMTRSSHAMSEAASGTNELSQGMLTSAQNAKTSVVNVCTATEELRSSIQDIGHQLTSTNQMVSEAKDVSENTVGKMKVLESSATEINNVIKIISEIASQTNLLALNATIEAERAGEAGKGFAVVADEVKTLAKQTAEATEQVRTQIDRIQNDTNEAVAFIQNVSGAIETLNNNIASIATAMEQQTLASRDIASSISAVSTDTETIVSGISAVNRSSENNLENSDTVKRVATDLSVKSQALKQSIDRFVSSM